MSLYERLGVDKRADSNEIRRAYLKLSRTHHPDKGGDEEEFKKIQQAYEVLTDDQKRAVYDQTGSVDGSAGGGGAGPGGGMPFPFPFDLGSMFHMFGGGGMGPPSRRRGAKGPPKVHVMPVSLHDFFHGKDVQISFDRHKFCPTCKGEGAERFQSCRGCGGSGHKQTMVMIGPGMNAMMNGPCPECQGQGRQSAGPCSGCGGSKFQSEKKNLVVQIRPGMRPGEILTFPNECSDQHEFLEPGDLQIRLTEADEEIRFHWGLTAGVTDDLSVHTTVGLVDALVGCTEKMDGHPGHPAGLTVTIPPGTQNGEVIRVEGEGMPRKDGTRGALHLIVHVAVKPEERGVLAARRDEIRGIFMRD